MNGPPPVCPGARDVLLRSSDFIEALIESEKSGRVAPQKEPKMEMLLLALRKRVVELETKMRIIWAKYYNV